MNDRINNNIATISDYCETALNIADKLADEYFFPVPDRFDEDVFTLQLDKIINNYHYLAFAVGIIREALKHISESNSDNADEIRREVV